MKTKTRVSVTMTQPYLEDLDRRVKAGIYLNRGQAVLAALRRVYGVDDPEGISRETRSALEMLAREGETYDALIRRLIEYHNQGVSAASNLMKPVKEE